MVLSMKQKKLLVYLLSEKDYKTSEYFADKLGVSIRTVYNDLDAIASYIGRLGVSLHRKPGVGLKVILEDKERLKLLGSINLNTYYVDQLSVQKRMQNIALSLLYADRTISMQEFSELYFVSKTSIAKDVERIEKTVAAFRLAIDKNAKGLRIRGEEKDIRKAIHHYIKTINCEQPSGKGAICKRGVRLDEITYHQMLRFFDAQLILDTEHCLIRAEASEGQFLSDTQYVNVLSHTLILIKRVQLGKENAFCHDRLSEIKLLQSYITAKRVLDELANQYGLVIPENEVAYLATYILSCNLNSTEYAFSGADHIEEKIDDCIEQMLAIASNILSIDLTCDEALKSGLRLHITPMLNRCKFQIKIDNPILADIQARYSSLYSVIQLLSAIIEDSFETRVGQEEIGYLTMYFAAAAERYLLQTPRKILVVCHGGLGTSQFLSNRIRQSIANIEIVSVVGSGRVADIDPATIDFIVSTVHLSDAPKPVILISPLLADHDIEKLNAYILGLHTSKNQEADQKMKCCEEMLSVIEEPFIFTGVQKKSKEEVLRFLCEKLAAAGCVGQGYFDSVTARERMSPTFVGNYVALPHGDEAHVQNEKIAFCLLKENIEWGGGEVKLVIFIAIHTRDKERFKKILKSLYHLFDDKEAMRQMMSAKQPRDIYRIVNSTY